MLHREDRQFEADHAADLARPQAAGIDDMLGMEVALFGDDVPRAVGARLEVGNTGVAGEFGALAVGRRWGGATHAPRVAMALGAGVTGAAQTVLCAQRGRID